MNTYVKAMAVWILLMFAETLHGTARVLLLAPLTGEFRAKQIAVFTGMLLIFIITVLLIKWMTPTNQRQCLLIGLLWVAFTLVFETVLGLMVFDMTWQQITTDYRLLRGGLMPIGLLFMWLAPLIAAKARKVL